MTLSFPKAVLVLFAVPAFAAVAGLPSVYPLLMLLPPAYLLLDGLPLGRWEKIALLPMASVMGGGLFVMATALPGLYSPWYARMAGPVLAIISMVVLIRRSRASRDGDLGGPGVSAIATGALALVLGLFFFYGMLFPWPSYHNGPYPAFAQMALDVVRGGGFHIPTAEQSSYDVTGFYYTPAVPTALAWIASFVGIADLNVSIGFLAPLLLTGFCGTMLVLGRRLGMNPTVMAVAVLMILPSYAIFRIYYEVDSDTPALPCVALFLLLLILMRGERRPAAARACLVWLTGVWAYSWWIRMHLAVMISFVLVAMVLSSREFRASIGAAFSGEGRGRSAVVAAACLFLFLMGPVWQALLWQKTGSPIAPRSLSFAGREIAVFDPAQLPYRPDAQPAAAPSGGAHGNGAMGPWEGIKYDFLPAKARAVVHGDTFSSGFSLLVLAGIAIAAARLVRRRAGILSAEGGAVLFLASLVLVVKGAGYYYKLFYAAVPFFGYLAALAISAVVDRLGGWGNRLLYAAAAGLAFVFTGSFVWSGVGTWPDDRRWAVVKADLSSPEARETVKNGETLAPAVRYLSSLPKDERFMYFHPEPGHSLAYLLDRRPFWDEVHHDQRRTAALHRATSREAALEALRALGVRHLVVSGAASKDSSNPDPDLLLAMISEGDPRLEPVAQSTGGSHRVFRLRP